MATNPTTTKVTYPSDAETAVQTTSQMQDIAVPESAKIKPQAIPTPVETIQTSPGQLGTVTTSTETGGLAGLEVGVPTAPKDLGQISSVATTQPGVGTLTGAQTIVGQDMLVDPSAVQGTLSQGALATAATQQLDQRATVSYQMDELFKAMQGQGPMPAWASASVRKVSGMMNARGLGSSSMAGAAITQAVMEAGIPIAAADAQKYATIQLQNLNNEQQSALQNATAIATMDMTNLDNRMKAAVQNAQTFLSVDLKNLDNEQQSKLLTYQSKLQALFTDTAAENARREMNAKNDIQVQEFFAELGSQVEAANKNRVSAMEQFNVSQKNAMSQFNSQMRDSREKFNFNMKFAVDQSNVAWRRQVNTADTTTQNNANMQNAMNAYNASASDLAQEWQTLRDYAQFNYQSSENELDRQLRTALTSMQLEAQDMFNDEDRDFKAGIAFGDFLGSLLTS